jgi:hypothetical protein
LLISSAAQVRTEQIVHVAHLRRDIETHGFNELVNGWHAYRVYRHQPPLPFNEASVRLGRSTIYSKDWAKPASAIACELRTPRGSNHLWDSLVGI